jgi:uncharacterized membrane protein
VARKRKTVAVAVAAAPVAAAPAAVRAVPRARFDRLDALRGVAIVWMAIFHFCYDLNYFGFIQQNLLHDPKWTLQRTAIVTLFLLCAGAGQEIASRQGQPLDRFWKRWAQVAGCALVVSLASWAMFPRSWISFGVLHGIAVMLIVVRFTASWGSARFGLGVVAIALPRLVQHPFFDSRATDWIGLVTHLPRTEDYVPVLPWLGVMWWGAVATEWLLRHRPAWLAGPLPRRLAPLAVLGRWSLTFYMTHQIVLLGGVAAAAWLLGRRM